jgi:hypothetical protein
MGRGRIAVSAPAGVAQLVEQLIRNQQVIGSSPIAGSRIPQTIGVIGQSASRTRAIDLTANLTATAIPYRRGMGHCVNAAVR